MSYIPNIVFSLSPVIFQQALDIRLSAFGGRNLHVAVAHEDLAYASYVHQYSYGKFDDAKWVPKMPATIYHLQFSSLYSTI